MAFLTTEATAASDDEFGRSGRGYIKTSWHRMPDAQVKTLASSDSLGDVEISWKLITFDGVKAYLTVGEARTLRDNLTAAITTVDISGTDNEVGDVAIVNEDDTTPTPPEVPMLCGACGTRIEHHDTPNGATWAHQIEPSDEHPGVPVWVIERSENKGA